MTTTQCCLFLCESCGWPNSLPLDTLRQRVQDQETLPSDYPTVAFACRNCMKMQIRSLAPRSPYNQTSDRLELKDQIEVASFVVLLTTCKENCEFQIPVFVTWDTSTNVKANDRWDHERPQEEVLTCPNGHPIRWEWREREKAAN
jgi:hypothetical protein